MINILPFVLKKAGLDPATSSAPFVATLVDVSGLEREKPAAELEPAEHPPPVAPQEGDNELVDVPEKRVVTRYGRTVKPRRDKDQLYY